MNFVSWTASSVSVIFPPMPMYITCAIFFAVFAVVVGKDLAVGFWGATISILTSVPVGSVVFCSFATAFLSTNVAHVTYLVLNAISMLLLYLITVVLRMRYTKVNKPPSPPQQADE